MECDSSTDTPTLLQLTSTGTHTHTLNTACGYPTARWLLLTVFVKRSCRQMPMRNGLQTSLSEKCRLADCSSESVWRTDMAQIYQHTTGTFATEHSIHS